MSDEQLRSPEYFEWLLHTHLKIKKHVSIPWQELTEAEPGANLLTSNPALLAALSRIHAAKQRGDEPSDEDLQTYRDKSGPQNPLLRFVQAYNWYHDDSDAGQDWAEHVLTELTHAKALEDLQAFSVGDWLVCAKLLQGDIPIPRRIIGELLEKIITEGEQAKASIPALGIKKPSRGRPSNPIERERYLTSLRFQFRVLTEKEGMTATRAYESIADEQKKDVSTIRRDLERFAVAREQQKKDIEARLAEAEEKQARLLEAFMKHQEGTARQPEDG
ncbi:hypothetical protein [Pseudomonas sp. GOM6]|uniref:hypothetical protein n=1 Tax=Pseudomonas sp. GOM6 TaxID=3036944 RepID=UPI002409B6B6|nr:hypothetical protein [Pseudomonas sp. GOM6]MDG1581289.1 hypothetical protein [Pseudomonas sp. GOM6]